MREHAGKQILLGVTPLVVEVGIVVRKNDVVDLHPNTPSGKAGITSQKRYGRSPLVRQM
jgi:hypothetical protein